MFKRLHNNNSANITIEFDGDLIPAVAGDSVASALLAAGVSDWRISIKSNQPRAPYCMMGLCFECLVNIEGQVMQACTITAEDGLVIHRINKNQLHNAPD